jgi:hypothetical protein
MSKYYSDYTQYLGAQRCCSLKSQGPQGPEGPTGPQGGVGQRGHTGPIGPTGPQNSIEISFTTPTNGIWYDIVDNKLKVSGSKTFVIDHPINKDKYLVHACLEGPEAGVYYRGQGEITDNNSVTIELPYYVESLATDFTVSVTPIFNGKLNTLNVSEVIDNKFNVYGQNCKFFWVVYGKRLDIDIELNKSETNVKGQGPYLYI